MVVRRMALAEVLERQHRRHNPPEPGNFGCESMGHSTWPSRAAPVDAVAGGQEIRQASYPPPPGLSALTAEGTRDQVKDRVSRFHPTRRVVNRVATIVRARPDGSAVGSSLSASVAWPGCPSVGWTM